MHRSRIGVVLIDVPDPHHDASRDFWGSALGVTPDLGPGGPYASLGLLGGGVKLETQRLDDAGPARVHLDIETDDVPAEVARLTALGATVAEARDAYTILRDPAGLVFCVVGVQTDDFADHATEWP